MPYVIALDQGTTSSRSIVFDESGDKIGVAQKALPQIFPRPGWVEHDPKVLWELQLQTARDAIANAGVTADAITALGIANQRETVVVWDRATGEPIHDAIVWQDRRTADHTDELIADGHDPMVHEKTGLSLDPYFSASKVAWILDHVDGARERAERGELAFGTVDTWLAWNLSGGALHVTDVTNASRTLLYDIGAGRWDDELLELFEVPASMLPVVLPSRGVFGMTDPSVLGAAIPIAGVCGDQQASLVGNGGFHHGDTKTTFGTGIFQLMYAGTERPDSEKLGITLAAQRGDDLEYAIEGSVFMGGAVVQWLVEELHVADDAAGAQQLAESVPDSAGVILVPALTGLGAPEWDPYARGAIFGLTRGSNMAHITRAAMESIPLQVADLAGAMVDDSGFQIAEMRVDGGVTVNSLVMQTLADVLDIPVHVAQLAESTALGVAFLAGEATGVWGSPEDLPVLKGVARTFEPDPGSTARIAELKHLWERAVARSLRWVDVPEPSSGS